MPNIYCVDDFLRELEIRVTRRRIACTSCRCMDARRCVLVILTADQVTIGAHTEPLQLPDNSKTVANTQAELVKSGNVETFTLLPQGVATSDEIDSKTPVTSFPVEYPTHTDVAVTVKSAARNRTTRSMTSRQQDGATAITSSSSLTSEEREGAVTSGGGQTEAPSTQATTTEIRTTLKKTEITSNGMDVIVL